ncbi:MAG: 3-dehydroquinate synthase [Chloroflexota bacterium]
MARIRVNAPGGVYDIEIARGLLADLTPERVGVERVPGRVDVVISNTTVAPLYADRLTGPPLEARPVTVPDGETYKTLETVSRAYSELIAAGMDRGGTVYALGGGVIGDMAGFVAATYMRGVRFVQVPTTLLAMVDSSVGGKVGVDLPEGKNLVGAFKQPDRVLIDPDVLRTLPPQEWRSGMAEVIKHGLLADESLLDTTLHASANAEALVARAVQVKVDVVEQDPFERGERAHLNLGHTFAHAIEQVSGYAWPHGEAVGFGLLAAARLSYAWGLCQPELVDIVDRLLDETGLPRDIGDLDPAAIWQAMRTDKKWRDGVSRFVLLREIGRPLIVENIPQDAVMRALTG